MSLIQSIVFRKAEKIDVDEIHMMLMKDKKNTYFHPHPFDKETILRNITGGCDYYYVLLLNAKVIGYSMLRLFGTEIPSFGCYINPRHRGNGYGRMLTFFTLKKADEMGYKKVILRVHRENSVALRMYMDAGFRFVSDEVMMECLL